MSTIEYLCQLIVERLQAKPEIGRSELVESLVKDISTNSELTNALKRDERMVQINKGDVIAFQTLVQGGVAHIGPQVHVDEAEIRRILEEIFRAFQIRNLPKELTVTLPKISPDKIIGREPELISLHERLSNQTPVLLINGLGGIGKTTLAQVYVAKHYQDYNHIAWISQTSDNFEKDFVSTDGLLTSLQIQKEGKNLKELFNEVIMGLKGIENGPNLLVIDNAFASLSPLLKKLPGSPWHILATSRELIFGFEAMELGFLSEDEAIALFFSHYTRGILSKEQVQAIVKGVDYHTLTIEILAKTAQRQRYRFDVLSRALDLDLKSGVRVDHNEQKIEQVMSYLCSTFELSRLTEDELWLMKQFACLPSKFLTYELLESLISFGSHSKIENLAEVFDDLKQKGWILNNESSDSFKMHRIIADVVASKLPLATADVAPLIQALEKRLEIDRIQGTPIDGFPWVPFGQACLARFENEMDPTIAKLQNNLAMVQNDLGEHEEAKALLEKSIHFAEEHLASDHLDTAEYYFHLAVVLRTLGNLEGAKDYLEKSCYINEHHFGSDHPSTTVVYSILGTILRELGDHERAKVLLEKALNSDEETFGPKHPTTASRYSNLALLMADLGDYERAKVLLEKALNSDEETFGPEHPATASRYSNLAGVLTKLGEYERAQILLEKAIHSAEKNFGFEHPNTIRYYSGLGLLRRSLKDYEEARILLEKALNSTEKRWGSDHPKTALSYFNLAMVLIDLKAYKEAATLSKKASKIAERSLPSDHPHLEKFRELYVSTEWIRESII